MKTKILLIAAAGALTVGTICHLTTGTCPLKQMKALHSNSEMEKK